MNSKLIQKHLSGNRLVFFCYHGDWKSRCAMRFFSSGIQNLGHATQLGCNRWTCSCTRPMNMKFHTQRELRQKKTDGHAAAHTTGKIIVYRVPNSLLNVFFHRHSETEDFAECHPKTLGEREELGEVNPLPNVAQNTIGKEGILGEACDTCPLLCSWDTSAEWVIAHG